LTLQFGELGVGLGASTNTFTISDDVHKYQYGFNYGYIGAAYAFWREQLVVGTGTGFGALDLAGWLNESADPDQAEWVRSGAVTWANTGWDLGALWRPTNLPLRIGASFRQPIAVDHDDQPEVPEEFSDAPLPGRVSHPWRLALGASYYLSFAGNPYNAPRAKRNPMKRGWDRRHVLFSVDTVLHGPAEKDATSMSSFLEGQHHGSGKQASISVHSGIESEVVNNRLTVRSGFYLEPGRLDSRQGRIHGTTGFDVRLFRLIWWDLRASLSLDLAPRYFNGGLGIGFWH